MRADNPYERGIETEDDRETMITLTPDYMGRLIQEAMQEYLWDESAQEHRITLDDGSAVRGVDLDFVAGDYTRTRIETPQGVFVVEVRQERNLRIEHETDLRMTDLDILPADDKPGEPSA